MKSHLFGFALLSAVAITACAPAQAQNGTLTRSFVSSSGVDTNPCTVTQPCATFAHAYTMVGANGIVAALDPGKYGPLTISGPVTIDGNGWAAITAPANSDGILINAGANDKVTLKGLNIDGVGTAADGVLFNAGGALYVFDCTIKNTIYNGISVSVTAGTALLVSNTFISNIAGNAASSGIYVNNGSSTYVGVIVTLDHVTISESQNDVSLNASGQFIIAMVTDSVLITNEVANEVNSIGLVTQGTVANVYITLKSVKFPGYGESVNLKSNTELSVSQVVESGLLDSSTSGANITVLCDGTNHISFNCTGTWTLK
jgi:hypothetical protein